MKKNYSYFSNRRGRALFITNTFTDELDQSQTILDVGCDNNILKHILVSKKVIGIDLGGNPDITVDLDKERLDGFHDNSFDFVVCTEVLEHLNDFHTMVDELFRVSSRYVLISLPNCMDVITKYNLVVHNKIGKYYGLPKKQTADRHKWFFSWKDLDIFFETYCKKNKLKIINKFLHYNFSKSLKAKFFLFIIKLFKIYSASQSYWIIIEKKRYGN